MRFADQSPKLHLQPSRLLKDDASPSGREGRARDEDARSTRGSARYATEDAVSRRSVLRARRSLLGTLIVLATFAVLLLSAATSSFGGGVALAADDLFRLDQDVTVAPGTTYKSVTVISGDITVDGRIDGNAFTANGDIVVHDGGSIGGDAISLTGRVKTEGTGSVGGNMVEVGWGRGGAQSVGASTNTVSIDAGRWNPLGWFILVLGAIGLGLFLVLISSSALRSIGGEIIGRPGRSALIGFVSLIGLPVLFVVLLITVVGIPLALLLIPVAPAMSLYGVFAFALVAGERLLHAFNKRDVRDVWAMVVGVILVGVIIAVPVLGWLAFVVACMVGFGATVGRLWDVAHGRRGRKEPMPPWDATQQPQPPSPPTPYGGPPYPVIQGQPGYPSGAYTQEASPFPAVAYQPPTYPAVEAPAPFTPPEGAAEPTPENEEPPPTPVPAPTDQPQPGPRYHI